CSSCTPRTLIRTWNGSATGRPPSTPSRLTPGRPRAAVDVLSPSCPQLALEPVYGLVERPGVGAGRQIFPASIGDDEADVRTLPGGDAPFGDTQRRMEDGTSGDPREDALLVEQLARPLQGFPGADRIARRENRLVI